IDPAITREPGWPVLAAAISRAHAAGYDVDQKLPRLAPESPLPPHQPALELHYRLLTDGPDAAPPPSAPAAAPPSPPARPTPPPPTAPPGRDRPTGPRR